MKFLVVAVVLCPAFVSAENKCVLPEGHTTSLTIAACFNPTQGCTWAEANSKMVVCDRGWETPGDGQVTNVENFDQAQCTPQGGMSVGVFSNFEFCIQCVNQTGCKESKDYCGGKNHMKGELRCEESLPGYYVDARGKSNACTPMLQCQTSGSECSTVDDTQLTCLEPNGGYYIDNTTGEPEQCTEQEGCLNSDVGAKCISDKYACNNVKSGFHLDTTTKVVTACISQAHCKTDRSTCVPGANLLLCDETEKGYKIHSDNLVTEINACDASPCKHEHGVCVDLGRDTFRCDCPSGFVYDGDADCLDVLTFATTTEIQQLANRTDDIDSQIQQEGNRLTSAKAILKQNNVTLTQKIDDVSDKLEAEKTELQVTITNLQQHMKDEDVKLNASLAQAEEDIESRIIALKLESKNADDAISTDLRLAEGKLNNSVNDLESSMSTKFSEFNLQLATTKKNLNDDLEKTEAGLNETIDADRRSMETADNNLKGDIASVEERCTTKAQSVEHQLNQSATALQEAIAKLKKQTDDQHEGNQEKFSEHTDDISDNKSSGDTLTVALAVLVVILMIMNIATVVLMFTMFQRTPSDPKASDKYAATAPTGGDEKTTTAA